jgi:hypothetical protein
MTSDSYRTTSEDVREVLDRLRSSGDTEAVELIQALASDLVESRLREAPYGDMVVRLARTVAAYQTISPN